MSETAAPDQSSEQTPLSPSETNVSVTKCEFLVRALKDWKGDELDDLSFNKGDVITVIKKDAAGWASGKLPNGNSGWFPLDCVEETHDNAVAEVGTKTGESALDAFIKEAKTSKKPTVPKVNALKLSSANRNASLNDFLASKPLQEQTVDPEKCAEGAVEAEAAQKRLLKMQKKRKVERAEVLIENLRNNWKPSAALELTEDEIDRLIVKVLLEIPLGKHKYHFSSYDNAFTGSQLLQHLKDDTGEVIAKFKVMTKEQSKALAQHLLERNVFFDAADPARKKFSSSNVYHMTSAQTEYTVLNLDKIYGEVYSGCPLKLSIQIVGEMIELMKKFLPNIAALRKSKELRTFGLRLTALQQVFLKDLSEQQQKIFFINIHNAMIMYVHARFAPPASVSDKRFAYEYCSVYTNKKRYSLNELEAECLKSASKEDPSAYFCISDCTKATPAVFIISEENYDMTQLFAIRHFLRKVLIIEAGNYAITFPKIFHRIHKDLELTNAQLIDLVAPFCSREQRDDIAKMKTVGDIEVKFHQTSFEPSYIFEEASPLSPR